MGTDTINRNDVLSVIKAVREEVRYMIEAAKAEISLSIGRVFESQIDNKVSLAVRELKEQIKSNHLAFQTTVSSLENTIRAIPRPEVNVTVPKLENPVFHVEAPVVNLSPADVIVNVPQQEAPTVNVTTPEVTVNVPQQEAPTVNVTTPEVTVNVPKQDQKPSVVNVTMPQTKPPEVNVTVPIPQSKPPEVTINVPHRKVTKHITYDDIGRPITIEESEG